MNIVAIIRADIHRSWMGTRSRLLEPLHGRPVLLRTLDRVSQSAHISKIVLLTSKSQSADIESLLQNDRVDKVQLFKYDGPDAPALPIVQMARKWSLDSWRGGMGHTCHFDEYLHPPLYAALAEQFKADLVVCVPAEAPLLDPKLIDAVIDQYQRQGTAGLPLAFAQAPPGLMPLIIKPHLLSEAGNASVAVGWVYSYRPDQPRRDFVHLGGCYQAPLAIQHASGRLLSDTRRGFELLELILSNVGEEADAETICRWLNQQRRTHADPWPQEIHIELTTEDQLKDTVLRPRGQRVGKRGPVDVDLLKNILEQAIQYDDVLVVLGGFGEPLLHPEFTKIAQLFKEIAPMGWAVRTNGIALDAKAAEAVVAGSCDVLQVMIDAQCAENYLRVHKQDAFDGVLRNVEACEKYRQSQKQIRPSLIASLTKSRDTFDDMDAFHEHWLKRSGWALIEGYSHHAQQLEDRMVISMAPPGRIPCRQIRNRLMILSNGIAVGCDQDFAGTYPVGDLAKQSLQEVWHSEAYQTLRDAHTQAQYARVHPLCNACEEWNRP